MCEEPHYQAPARPLSPRELAILRKVTRGAANREIARTLSITEAAVWVHLKGLFKKVGVQNRAEAALWAVHHEISDA
jgi:two-component system nitrate/nitrite response regulator NarL